MLDDKGVGLRVHSCFLDKKEGEKMSKKETYEARTEELLLPIVEENGLEIYDVEYTRRL